MACTDHFKKRRFSALRDKAYVSACLSVQSFAPGRLQVVLVEPHIIPALLPPRPQVVPAEGLPLLQHDSPDRKHPHLPAANPSGFKFHSAGRVEARVGSKRPNHTG